MDLSRATDELLAAPWDSFVETRTRLAAELAGAGRRDDSRALKKIRRPTAAAWATNQVVRRARAAVDAYLAASDALRDRQAAMLEGGGGDRAAYQAATGSFRQATAALTQAVRNVLGHEGREPDRAQVEGVMANVRAAALGDDRRAELLAGRLLAELPAGEGGLEGVFGASLAASAAATGPVTRAPAPHEKPYPAPARDHQRTHAEAHAKRETEGRAKREAEARAKHEEHARRLAAAADEEARAREAAATATAEAEQARAARAEAEERLKDAEAAVVKARQELHDAKATLQTAERTAKDSQAAVDRATERREALEKESRG